MYQLTFQLDFEESVNSSLEHWSAIGSVHHFNDLCCHHYTNGIIYGIIVGCMTAIVPSSK